MPSSFVRNAIVLGLLAAVGPFAIDMYLPALPTIAADLHASTAATQMTLMVFFVTFGVSQLAYGPVSDMAGRKPPLYFGLVVLALGGIGCGLAPTIAWLIFFRFVQGGDDSNTEPRAKLSLRQQYAQGLIGYSEYRRMSDYFRQSVRSETSWLSNTGRW